MKRTFRQIVADIEKERLAGIMRHATHRDKLYPGQRRFAIECGDTLTCEECGT